MALLQVLAASAAGVNGLVFHTGPPGGDGPLWEAMEIEGQLFAGDSIDTADLIEAIVARRFLWV